MNFPDEFDRLYASDDESDRDAVRRRAESDSEWQSRLAWEERLDQAARSLHAAAPDGLFEKTLATYTAQETSNARPHLLLYRFAAAAVVVVLATLAWNQMIKDAPEREVAIESLLSDSGLAAAVKLEGELERREEQLRPAVEERGLNPAASPLAEQIALLDDAIGECRRALEVSGRHRHLRDRLHALTRQRLDVLSTLARGP